MTQQYIATKPIEIDGARGYVAGDVVADDVVERFNLSDSVARSGSKAAEKAQSQDGGSSQS